MGILDKLIEKKDMLAFIGIRIEQLERNKTPFITILENAEATSKQKKKAQKAVFGLSGRVKELERLRMIVNENRVKSESKKMWISVNK